MELRITLTRFNHDEYPIPEFTDIEAAKKYVEEWGKGGVIEVISNRFVYEPKTTYHWVEK